MIPMTRPVSSSLYPSRRQYRNISSLQNVQAEKNETSSVAIQEAISCTPFYNKKNTCSSFTTKLNSMLQNFYTKTALIIIQARLVTSRTDRLNKWFSLTMTDILSLRNELRFWQSRAVYPCEKCPPAMIIHIYLDTTHLSLEQIQNIMKDYMHHHRFNRAYDKKKIILESWTLTCKQAASSDDSTTFDLPSLYKQFITYFRALHSLTRLLPGCLLFRQLQKEGTFGLCYRLGTDMNSFLHDELNPDSGSLLRSAVYEFSDIDTPIGTLQLKVHYRITDRMNGDYSILATERKENVRSCRQRQPILPRSQSSPLLQHQRKIPILHDNDTWAVTKDEQEWNTVSTYGQDSSTCYRLSRKSSSSSSSSSTSSRKASTLCISPFKSPSLSSASTLTTSTMSNHIPIVEKSKSSSITESSKTPSGSFLSSFQKCKTTKSYMSRQNTIDRRTHKTSLEKMNQMLDMDDEFEKFVRLINTKHELKLCQGNKSMENIRSDMKCCNNDSAVCAHYQDLSTRNDMSDSLTIGNDTCQRFETTLGRFLALRCGHSDLEESMTSNIATTTSFSSPSHSMFSTTTTTTTPSLDHTSVSSTLALPSASSFNTITTKNIDHFIVDDSQQQKLQQSYPSQQMDTLEEEQELDDV
ncbi:autophagy-related protein 13-domain-containing protein [Halteromyces radiatus]|uniref:autophagy-related protein 13-domain-containing protein n=1 Tax=Halteromyces radiatus TaxID=101107 RepID=UPI0022201F61|nr:autophagy-related protein 13-domain-containing protein [Halteromyces radiatus]KAI8083105.1 autophagy-related protein 13-domain-containing protein [Halteromyces radiatus]